VHSISSYNRHFPAHYARFWLQQNISREVSQATRIIYGGRVTSEDAAKFAPMSDVDGFLLTRHEASAYFMGFR
jgi:triosephosphate isomerase